MRPTVPLTTEGLRRACPECGAQPDQLCSEPDPSQDGLGVELHTRMHTQREIQPGKPMPFSM